MKYCLDLCKKPIIFDPLSDNTEIFFDHDYCNLVTVKNKGENGITLQSFNSVVNISFRVTSLKEICRIKFSKKLDILAVQSSKSCIEFFNIENGVINNSKYCQLCKSNSEWILNFYWTSDYEVLFITNTSLQLYQVQHCYNLLVPLKICLIKAEHCHWEPSKHQLFVISRAASTYNITIYDIDSSINKIACLDVPKSELSSATFKLNLFRFFSLNSTVYLCTFRKLASDPTIVLYKTTDQMASLAKSHVLELPFDWKCRDISLAISIVDNLVVLHNKEFKFCLLYDVNIISESRENVNHVVCIVSSCSISPTMLQPEAIFRRAEPCHSAVPIQPYCDNWAFFHPHFVIDLELGCMWKLELNLEVCISVIPDPLVLVRFLVNRSGSRDLLLSTLQKIAFQFIESNFDHEVDKNSEEYWQMVPQKALSPQSDISVLAEMINIVVNTINKEEYVSLDLNQKVLLECMFLGNVNDNRWSNEDTKKLYKIVSDLFWEFLRALTESRIPLEEETEQLLVDCIVKSEEYHQLTLFLLGKIISNSKMTALQLLALHSNFNQADQIALDMLKRTRDTREVLLEIFLSKNDPICALRYALGKDDVWSDRDCDANGVPSLAKKLLEVAKKTNDLLVFHSTFQHVLSLKPCTKKEAVGKKNYKNLKQLFAADQHRAWPAGAITYRSIDAAPSSLPPLRISDLSGIPCQYTEPKSGLRFATSAEYSRICDLPQDVVNQYLAFRGVTQDSFFSAIN
ncbi:hypothetical protein Ciccas_004770 [Cichlidogyrus casuarinus]|uniref:Vps72/YL1 C-terminal domain-containing protein n=1 Tax=Cichlidogyrus casuarinus TaxID=1844966 RepID=A0ABD2QAM5_9PLAT